MIKESQCEKILNHLKANGSITPLEAMSEYGIMRLASRISDLKDQGYKIRSAIVSSRNRNGDKVHYSVYSLEE